ncbi:TonB system transport protein ExbB, partial [Pseudomonas syringae pv. antirrhini]
FPPNAAKPRLKAGSTCPWLSNSHPEAYVMNTAYSVLITQSSMTLLVIFSLVTWALLLGKTLQHWRLSRQNRRYSTQFWAARDLKNALHLPHSEGSLARLTDAGAQALATPHDSPDLGHSWNRQDLLERSLRQQI